MPVMAMRLLVELEDEVLWTSSRTALAKAMELCCNQHPGESARDVGPKASLQATSTAS